MYTYVYIYIYIFPLSFGGWRILSAALPIQGILTFHDHDLSSWLLHSLEPVMTYMFRPYPLQSSRAATRLLRHPSGSHAPTCSVMKPGRMPW